jgi:PPP family 3-phenylpropionic acid transporter
MSTTLPRNRSASRRAAVAASASYALLLSGLGVYLPFFPVWLAGRGFNATEIGLLLAIPMLMRVLASAPFARLADGPLGVRRTFLIMVCGSAFGYAALFFTFDFWAVALTMTILSAFLAPTAPLLDVIALNGVAQHGHDYGRLRQWGSVAWLVSSLAAGGALAHLPIESLPAILAILAALTVFAGLALPDDSSKSGQKEQPVTGSTAPPMVPFLILATGVAFLQGAHSFLYGFATIIWENDGFTKPQIGLLWGIGVVLETALFLFAGNMAGRLGPYAMIMIGGAAGLARWTLMGLEPGSGLAIAGLQGMHGLSFAAVHLGTMGWLSRFEKDRATRQGIVASAIGAGLVAGTALAGFLFERLGPHGYFAMAAVALVGSLLVLTARRLERRPS